MNDIKQLAGIMNLDDSEMVMPSVHHKRAINGFFRGNGNNYRFESAMGNTLIPNALLEAGDNQCIGHFFDELRQRLFFFIYNSNGNHGIYIYYVSSNTFQTLLVVGAGTDGDILNFSLTTVIHSVNLLYGGSSREDGDILYYIDSLKRPTQINVDKFLNNPFTVVKRSFIDVIKAPASFVPQAVYENDTTVNINNLKGSLYKFATVWVYGNNETSVFSSPSVVPLPYQINNPPNTSDISSNARIAVYVHTGDADTRKIRIYGRRATIDSISDYFLIIELDKDDLSIPDNDIYRYVFYNNSQYLTVESVEDSIQLFDYVPDESNTQELLNGETLIYAGIKEGQDAVVPNMTVMVGDILNTYQYYNGTLFFGFKKSSNTIVLYVTGAGTNDGSGNPTDLVNAYATFNVVAQDAAFADISFSYVAGAMAQNIPTVLSALATAATGQGWSVVATGTNTLELSFATDIIFASAFTANTDDATVRTNQDAAYSLSEASRYSLGVQYFSSNGKTNGVTYQIGLSIDTLKDNVISPLITLQIYHRPPLWASYYHVVRTDTETYLNKTYWVSSSAYSNDTPIGSSNNTRYAYVDIDNMTSYSQDLNTDGASVTYDFAKGDRIRFLGVFNDFMNPSTPTIYSPYYDYEIIGVKIDPFINGIKRIGRFLQIVYPSSNITSTFKFDGTPEYSNYYVLIYTPKTSVSVDNKPFFEFGKKFDIANAGTNQAIHLGQEQIQSVDLVTPAIIKFADGDLFFRKRDVPKSPTFQAGDNIGLFDTPFEATIAITLADTTVPLTISSGVINNQNATYGSVTNPALYPTSASTDFIYNNTSGASTRIRIRFDATVGSEDRADNIYFWAKIFNSTPPILPFRYKLLQTFPSSPNVNLAYSADIYMDVYTTDKVFLMVSDSASDLYAFSYTNLRIDVIDVAPISIIEKTWNDYTPIIFNSDGRPTAIDQDAERTYNPTLVRWGLSYQQNTNINDINRFKALNYDIADSRYGDVQRLMMEGRLLYVYQNRRVGQYGIYARYVSNNQGESQLLTTDDIITANNIQYLDGDWGIGEQPTSVVRGRNAHYFGDPIRGQQVRRAANGLQPISMQNKAQFYMPTILSPFSKTWTRAAGGNAKIMGVYDYLEDEYVCVVQSRDIVDAGESDPVTISFNENRNGYSSFFEYFPEWIAAVNQSIYSWVDGDLYVHTNTATYCNYYGVQKKPSIQLVFNMDVLLRKTFKTIQYVSYKFWVSETNGDIYTSEFNEQTGFLKISQLKQVDYETRGSFKNAALKFDANSLADTQLAVVNGDVLAGIYIVVNLTFNGTDFAFIYAPSISSQEDPLNFKKT